MKFDFYLFDLDGTLLHLGNIGIYVDQLLAKTLEILGARNLPKKDEKYRLWASKEEFYDVLEEWGVKNSRDFWKVFDETDFKWRKKLIEKKQVFLYKDVYSSLEEIYYHKDSKKIALVSNTAYYIVEYILDTFGIAKYFHETFSLGNYENDQELAKPSPKGILKILEKLKYDPRESTAVFVGDSRLDIIAAKKAKINACLIRREINQRNMHYKKWNIPPDLVIEGLNELINLK